MSHFDKSYSNGDITVFWKPELCIHSGNCVRGLPTVFNNQIRPWIQPEHSTTEEIIKTVNTCPSGALSYKQNTGQPSDATISS